MTMVEMMSVLKAKHPKLTYDVLMYVTHDGIEYY